MHFEFDDLSEEIRVWMDVHDTKSNENYTAELCGTVAEIFSVWQKSGRLMDDAGFVPGSLGGQAGGRLLRLAFARLHEKRSQRYQFRTRPEDFQIATQEAANVFIKPWGDNGIEVLNPSVLDLMNSVVCKTRRMRWIW